jgi:hypothetical protein
VPDPETIIAGFQAEYDQLMELVRIVAEDEARAKEVAAAAPAEAPAPSLLEAEPNAFESPAEPPAPAVATGVNGQGQPLRCQAISKKSGNPCRNPARPGSLYCAAHQPQAEQPPAPEG